MEDKSKPIVCGEESIKKEEFHVKDKSKDIEKLKQKLEKVNGKIEALLETKADIMRQMKEAEQVEHESHATAEKPTDVPEAAASSV
ncbi:hypothetical protein SLA2020_420240 [Shorea laevis]